jgi:methylthioribulose-1-phosphate dehydratase
MPTTWISSSQEQIPELMCELCRQFYGLGWVSGTGGGISIRGAEGIYMAPSGVQKERLRPEDIYLLDARELADAKVLCAPADASLKLSECRPLFYNAYRLRDAGAVLHSHSLWAMLASRMFAGPRGNHFDGNNGGSAVVGEFVCSGLEMQKGLRGIGCFDTVRVPIIANTARESELTASMAEAMQAYPAVDAVLVAGPGVYVWGKDWAQAKTQAECYDYLFRAVVEANRLGVRLAGD